MDDTQIAALQNERLPCQQIQKFGVAAVGQFAPRGVVAAVVFVAVGEKPAGAVFGFAGEQVEFVVAQHHEGIAGGMGFFEPLEHGGGVGAPIDQVAHKHQFSALRMPAVGGIAQIVQQVLQGFELSVNIADDV